MKIQSQSHQFPDVRQAAGPSDPPSAHFDGSTQYIDAEGVEFELTWVAPDAVEVILDGQVVGELNPDQDWASDQITGWDYIEHLLDTMAWKYLENR